MSESTIRMLLVDEKSPTTDIDRAGYRNMGILVRKASNFQQTLDQLKEVAIDLVVINYDYAEIDPLAIAQHLKTDERFNELRVVITSVQSNAASRKKILDTGVDLFIEQPIPRQVFVEKVRKMLSQKTRDNNRVGLVQQATVHLDSGKIIQASIGDISTTGILLSGDLKLEIAQIVKIDIQLPGLKKPLKAVGEVVRKLKSENSSSNQAIKNDRFDGIGIKFKSFEGSGASFLEDFVNNDQTQKQKLVYYL